jgi:hypothetical protein
MLPAGSYWKCSLLAAWPKACFFGLLDSPGGVVTISRVAVQAVARLSEFAYLVVGIRLHQSVQRAFFLSAGFQDGLLPVLVLGREGPVYLVGAKAPGAQASSQGIERVTGHRPILRSPGFPVQRIALDIADQLVNCQRVRCGGIALAQVDLVVQVATYRSAVCSRQTPYCAYRRCTPLGGQIF